MRTKNIIFTLTGPSGSGKTTLANIFKEKYGEQLVSYTSRPQRPEELDGVDYYFVTKEQALELKQESVEFTEYNNNYYGYLNSEFVEKTDTAPVVAVVDINGFKEFNKHYEIVPIFLLPSLDKIKNNMLSRNDTRENIDKRISLYNQEVEGIQSIYNINKNSILFNIEDTDTLEDLSNAFSMLITDILSKKKVGEL